MTPSVQAAGEPFDRSLKSPIATILEFYARAPGAVVGVRGMSGLQEKAYIPSRIEDRLTELLSAGEPPDLWVMSGSAGYGKSALIDQVVHANPDRFSEIVQDATHSDSPSESQADRLADFFQPFADGSPRPAGGPRIIAANTGMLLGFFATLHDRGDRRFGQLEAVLKFRLGISDDPPPGPEWTVAVLNLDLRPTSGAEGLLRGMLELLDFTNTEGLLDGAPRCATCRVGAFCPVRSNSIVASQVAGAAIDRLASQAATERARHFGPRQLYDFAARALTGDDPFDGHDDPCDAVAAAADRGDNRWVWERLLPRKLFALGGEIGDRIAPLDPSRRPDPAAHRILASAGLRHTNDARLIESLDPGPAEAAATAASYIRDGEASAAARSELARALVAAAFLQSPDEWKLGDEVAESFGAARQAYDAFSRGEPGDIQPLEDLRRLIERALAHSFGVLEGGRPFIPVKAYDPRDPSLIFVSGALENEPGSFQLLPDPARERDAEGAALAGHYPLAITVTIGGVRLSVSLPVYRLLWQAAGPTLASTADLERFYGLRHAVDALGRRASQQQDRDLMVERPGTGRHYLVRRSTGLTGQDVITAQELGR